MPELRNKGKTWPIYIAPPPRDTECNKEYEVFSGGRRIKLGIGFFSEKDLSLLRKRIIKLD